MTLSRRDLLTLVGGASLGLAFSPAPWKLLGDSAIWTQNWSWVPKPPRGEPRVKFTTCTLCPAGCGMRARGVGEAIVSLAGIAGHPASRGALCPIGVAAHHLPFLASRVKQATRHGAAITVDAAAEEIRKSLGSGPVSVVDLRPGRTASLMHRRFAAGVNGLYVTPGLEPFAVDLEKTRTLVSFGAPVLDGWGTPGRVMAARPNFRLIQVEAVDSRTAALADQWIAPKPGSEAALALGLAQVLGADFAADFTPARVAAVTGIPAEKIIELAHTLAANQPAVAIAGTDPAGGPLGPMAENAITGLNLALGGAGKALFRRREAPGADDPALAVITALADVPDAHISLLLVDEAPGGDAVPWAVLRRKLAPQAVVVALTSSPNGIARHADYVIPATVFPETLSDAGAPPDQTAAVFSLSPALAPKPKWAVEPAEFLARLGGQAATLEDALKQRVEAIKKAQRGTVFSYADGKQISAEAVEDLWKALGAGALWTDDAAPQTAALQFTPRNLERALEMAADHDFPLTAMPSGWRNGGASPLVSKLYIDSDLRSRGGVAWMHPETAKPYGVAEGARVALRTRCGTCNLTAAFDAALMPGIVQVTVGPGGEGAGAMDICDPDGDGTWRMAPAALAKA